MQALSHPMLVLGCPRKGGGEKIPDGQRPAIRGNKTAPHSKLDTTDARLGPNSNYFTSSGRRASRFFH
jgi:hypothetical protein